MNRAISIVAALLVAIISGCAKDFTLPAGVLSYVDIAAASTSDALPQVAFDGTNYLVVYENAVTTTDHDIIAALVNPGGMVLSSVDIDASSNDDRVPKVAFDGRNYLVVFQRTTPSANQDIFGAFVSTAGAVQTGSPFSIDNSTNNNLAPAVAFNPVEATYLVAYQRTTSSTNHDIIGALVDTAGDVLAGSPFDIDVSANDDLAPGVGVAFDLDSSFSNYLVVYQRTSGNHNIIGARISPTGSVLSYPNIDISANDDTLPRVASNGANYLVSYQRTVSSSNHDIMGASVSTAGVVGIPFAIDDTLDDDLAPAVASDGTNYLVVYQRTASSSNHNIIGTRITSDGSISGSVAIDTTDFDDFVPALAFGNGSYLVAYEEATTSENHDIFGAFVAQ